MDQLQISKSFRHFSRHLFLVNRIHLERKKAREEVHSYLDRMRKSVIKMSLTYSNIDMLRQKIENLIECERKYAKFFKPEDRETQELKNNVNALEQELMNEREEKLRITSENNEKISQLTGTLNNIKNQMKYLQLEKAKRQQRLKALENKIHEKVDVRGYYNS